MSPALAVPLPVLVLLPLIPAAITGILAHNFEAGRSRRLWSMPWGLWALIGYAIGVFGILLWLIAYATSKDRGPGVAPPRRPGEDAPGSGPPDTPGAPGGSGGWQHWPGTHPGFPPLPPPGWHPDPSGRHRLRYWNGTAWTEHVSDDGGQGIDPP